ncbi:hypothetical protein [Amycolatopsis sp. NPDC059657]|uniref:hypothetical protein n=1 Tax=Amycolatopsis sp. NPDC059657 TaxID=3346899 RepID=UPI0036702B8E
MSIFDDIADVAEAVGDGVVEAVGRGVDALNEISQGDFAGAWNAVLGGNRNVGGGPGDLVKQIQEGKGTATLQRARDIGQAQSGQQDQIETDSRQMMSALESAWTGKSSDAARVYVEPLATTAASASESLRNNSNIVQDQIHQFDSLKNTLHKDVTNEAPERGFWDKATPWDTDTEDAIEERNRKVQENLQRYNTYAAQTDANKPAMTTDYGQLTDDQGGDFKLEKEEPPTPPRKKTPPENPGKHETTGKSSEETGKQTVRPGDPGYPLLYSEDRPNGLMPPDDTKTSSYKPPTTATPPLPHETQVPVGQYDSTRNPNQYLNSNFGPGTGTGSGAGTGGTRGFGTGSGGGSSSGAGQNMGAGKGSGAGMPGEGAARGGPAGGNAGRGGRPGAPGMGGMPGGAKGQGEEDTEHQRPSYLVEADPESVFGTDAKTAPPVIGA